MTDFNHSEIEEYCISHSSPQSSLLCELERKTLLRSVYPRMISGALQGRFLATVSQMVQPFTILEIGTFTGYSALCLCEGLKPGGRLITIDNNPEIETLARSFFERSDYNQQIEFIIDDAARRMEMLMPPFDLVFLDADKENYPRYLTLASRLLNKGGWLLADNVLWGGHVLDASRKNQKETKGVVVFNQMLANDPQYQVVMLPLRDGLTLARKIC